VYSLSQIDERVRKIEKYIVKNYAIKIEGKSLNSVVYSSDKFSVDIHKLEHDYDLIVSICLRIEKVGLSTFVRFRVFESDPDKIIRWIRSIVELLKPLLLASEV